MTVKTDNFNRANQLNLGTSSEGWSWSTGDLEVSGGNFVNIASNEAVIQTPGTICAVRAEVDLASNDNYAQYSLLERGNAGAGGGQGVCCRMSTGLGPSYYMAFVLDTGSDNLLLYKNTGVQNFVQLGSTTSISISLPQTVKVQAVGSTIKAYFAGAELISTSDSAVTAGLRGGSRQGGAGSVQTRFDNFEMGDVGGAAFNVAWNNAANTVIHSGARTA